MTLAMMVGLNSYMVYCALTRRKYETYRWIPLILTLVAAFMIMAEPSRHYLIDKALIPGFMFREYKAGCGSETWKCLALPGIIFTILFTYIGFFLLFWGTMWNANLWSKLKSVPKKWRAIRRKKDADNQKKLLV
eukprot:TRINITY_DN1299_c0_g1_i1.p1 TRINITY_DN1299_c0_g1~~TRINITY_DN1299_c0_g1_i1.p1  ORF type:complete len:134 (-),score=29.05 TRINITY_DN1299_c0_g1_i1:203-604(-)